MLQPSDAFNEERDHPQKHEKLLNIASFSVLAPEQIKYVKPTEPVKTYFGNPNMAAFYASSSWKYSETDDFKKHYWFPKPEDPGDPQEHTPIQKQKQKSKNYKYFKK